MQCLLSTTIMWKISTHMMSTCCPALFYEGHSCDTETSLFKGSHNVGWTGGRGVIQASFGGGKKKTTLI